MSKLNLQQNESLLLKFLKDGKEKTVHELETKLKLDQAAVVRASKTLEKNELAVVDEKTAVIVDLTKEGKSVLKSGLPEVRLLKEVKLKPIPLVQIKIGEKNIAIGWAKRKNLVVLEKKGNAVVVKITDAGRKSLKGVCSEELALEEISQKRQVEEKLINELKKRQLVRTDVKIIRKIMLTKKGVDFAKRVKIIPMISQLTPELLASGKWKNVAYRKYNVLAPVRPVYPGKRHFVSQAVEYLKKVYLEMGFKEMTGPLVNTSFWNFDALFVPQDHPARDMQDTFFVEPCNGELPDNELVQRVRKMHEKGDKESYGWNCKWEECAAKKTILRTHTTVLSSKTLASIKKEDLPAKYFAIGRCFRNETLDWSHLFEFNQFEGIVVDPDANFRHLLGYLKLFCRKLGFGQARFRPAYFPYTEMSLEFEVFHPYHKKWVELGGAGIFRPEVVKPLLGEDIPVLAWGPGFDRMIMDYYKIKDIRNLYKNDIQQLRETKQWMR